MELPNIRCSDSFYMDIFEPEVLDMPIMQTSFGAKEVLSGNHVLSALIIKKKEEEGYTFSGNCV